MTLTTRRCNADLTRIDKRKIMQSKDGVANEERVGANTKHRLHELVAARPRDVIEPVETVSDIHEPSLTPTHLDQDRPSQDALSPSPPIHASGQHPSHYRGSTPSTGSPAAPPCAH